MSDIVNATAAAAAAVAVARPIATVTCRLLEKLAEDPLKELSGILGDHVRRWRTVNAAKVAAIATRKLDERDLLDAEIPLRFLGPAIERIADVDEPELQELWAELIANGAVDEESRHPRFAQTLADMDRSDAVTFEEFVRLRWGTPFPPDEAMKAPFDQDAMARLSALGLVEVTISEPPTLGPRRRQPELEELYRLMQQQRSQFARFQVVSGYGWQFARAIGLRRTPPEAP